MILTHFVTEDRVSLVEGNTRPELDRKDRKEVVEN